MARTEVQCDALLRSPLEFSRITSGFCHASSPHPAGVARPSRHRLRRTYWHARPCHGGWRGEFAATQGGYRKVAGPATQQRLSTAYGHLSGFAKGLQKGTRSPRARR